jgi:hypothetical protein
MVVDGEVVTLKADHNPLPPSFAPSTALPSGRPTVAPSRRLYRMSKNHLLPTPQPTSFSERKAPTLPQPTPFSPVPTISPRLEAVEDITVGSGGDEKGLAIAITFLISFVCLGVGLYLIYRRRQKKSTKDKETSSGNDTAAVADTAPSGSDVDPEEQKLLLAEQQRMAAEKGAGDGEDEDDALLRRGGGMLFKAAAQEQESESGTAVVGQDTEEASAEALLISNGLEAVAKAITDLGLESMESLRLVCAENTAAELADILELPVEDMERLLQLIKDTEAAGGEANTSAKIAASNTPEAAVADDDDDGDDDGFISPLIDEEALANMQSDEGEGGGKGMTDEHGGGEDDGAPATVPDPEATAIIDLVLPASNFLSRLKRSKSKQ